MKLNREEGRALVTLANAGMIPHEFSTVCYQCVTRRPVPAGSMRFYANEKAAKHAARKPGHTVYILDYGVSVGKRYYSPSDELPMSERVEAGF